jgi:hypothetical protein
MVKNSTNINKTNNHISPQIIEHITNTTIYDAGNTGPGLGQANKYGRVKPVNGISTIHPPLDNWISNGKTYINI